LTIQYDPLRFQYRSGISPDDFVPKFQTLKIINNRILLDEQPDNYQHVTIKGYNEKTSLPLSALTSTQFYVDYFNSFVYFNASEEGKSVFVSYLGKGIAQVPASRVYVTSEIEPDITKYLQNIVDGGEAVFGAANTIGLTVNEVQDARDSTAKGKAFTDVRDRLEEIETDAITHEATIASKAPQSALDTTNVNLANGLALKVDQTTYNAQLAETISQLVAKAAQADLLIANANITSNTSQIAANTSNIATNATAIAAVANGSPKATYATLLALQSAFPTGTTGIYLVTADGHWYYWNGSAWASGGTYQSSGVANSAIRIEHTDFVQSGVNLFNKLTATSGHYINSLGVMATDATYYVSDFIAVLPSTLYSRKFSASVNYYDSSKTWISNQAPGLSGTTPSNAAYARINGLLVNIDSEQFQTGASTAYEGYGVQLKNILLKSIPKSVLSSDVQSALSVANYIDIGVNLFNQATVTKGYLVGSTGSLLASSLWYVSDFIPVLPNTVYSRKLSSSVNYYDSSYNWLSNQAPATTMTTPYNTVYARINGLLADLASEQFQVGASTTYVPYGVQFKTIKPSSIPINALTTDIQKSVIGIGNKLLDYYTLSRTNFSTLPSDWVNNGFTVSNGLQSPTTGSTSILAYFNFRTFLDEHIIRARVKIADITSKFCLFNKFAVTFEPKNKGTIVEIDCQNNVINFYEQWDVEIYPTTMPPLRQSFPLGVTIVANRDYIVSLQKYGTKRTLTIKDTVTGVSNSVYWDNSEHVTNTDIGSSWGTPGIMFLQGNILVKKFEFILPTPKDVKTIIFGDSITEGFALNIGSNATAEDRWCAKIRTAIKGNCAIAGKGGGMSADLVARLDTDLDSFTPKYVVVLIGTNDAAAANITAWTTNINTIISRILAKNAIPILCVPPLNTLGGNYPSNIAQMGVYLRSLPYTVIGFDYATSVGNDGVTCDTSLFVDGTHPNVAGNLKMYNQVLIDAPEIME